MGVQMSKTLLSNVGDVYLEVNYGNSTFIFFLNETKIIFLMIEGTFHKEDRHHKPDFLRNYHIVFYSVHHKCTEFQFLHILTSICYFLVF